MEWFQDFLANKLLAPILLALLILCGVGLAIQTVRINGVSLFGWYAVDGYKPLYEAALLDNSTLKTSVSNLDTGLKTCNASVAGMKSASDRLTAQANHLIEIANGIQAKLNGNIAALRAVKSSDEKCPVADMILEKAFQ